MTTTPPDRDPRRRTRLRSLAALATFAIALAVSGCASSRALQEAQREEAREHWDMAVLAWEKAAALEPGVTEIRMGLMRAKLKAAQVHYERGRVHHNSGQLDMALAELEQSIALDSTSDAAQQELRKTKADIEARARENAGGTPVEKAKARARGMRGAPPMLNPSSTKPIDVTFPPDSNIKKIYAALGAAAGINVIYDPQLKDDKFTVELRGMTFQKALETTMRQAGHFYKVIDEKTILIAQDTQQNRKEYEDLVIRTFFLSNGDVKDVSQMVRSILDLRRLAVIPQLNAVVIRDTADKVSVAERLIEVNDKAKSEVVVDVELLQVNTDKLLNLGATLSSQAPLTVASVVPGAAGGATTAPASLPWNAIKGLGISDFMFTIPSVAFNFLKNNTDAELLAKPQLRIAEGEKAQLVIGDRYPIPVTTINTQTAIGSTGVVPVTSFQYQDVGIKIDMEPRVHHNREVSLKLTIEVSQISGKVPVPGQSDQPIIGTRTITSSIRLKDGETSFLAGLIRKDSTKSKSMIPFLSDLPLIGVLFTNNNTEDKRTDLYLTLTPHIIRSPQITDEDLIPIWVGTENNVSFSGLNTALQSPNATGSPFDAPPTAAPPARSVASPAPGVNIPQGGMPNDPFRRTVPVPAPTPAPVTPQSRLISSPAPAASAMAAAAETSSAVTAAVADAPSAAPATSAASAVPAAAALSLEATSALVAPGEVSVVNLTGVSGLAPLSALELTVEWDPSVAEVTGIAPGAWRNGDDAASVRFDADRTSGRAHLHFARTDSGGLPDGVLAKLAVRGVAPGTTLVRVTAGAASTARGPAAAPVVEAAPFTVKPAS
jgi:general secretion pathway protein D